MGQISHVKDIVDAIVYLTEAGQVTGEVLTWMAVRVNTTWSWAAAECCDPLKEDVCQMIKQETPPV
jgi:hypothetical protein